MPATPLQLSTGETQARRPEEGEEVQPSLHWGQEWELGREPLLWPPCANQKQVLGVTEEGEGCDNVGHSCLQACLPSFSRPWLQAAPETLCTLVPGELPPFWGPRPRQRAASPGSAQTGQTHLLSTVPRCPYHSLSGGRCPSPFPHPHCTQPKGTLWGSSPEVEALASAS